MPAQIDGRATTTTSTSSLVLFDLLRDAANSSSSAEVTLLSGAAFGQQIERTVSRFSRLPFWQHVWARDISIGGQTVEIIVLRLEFQKQSVDFFRNVHIKSIPVQIGSLDP